MSDQNIVTAAVLLIGDELLSGRTRDSNLGDIAGFLQPIGVQVGEARIVRDVSELIIAALNELRARHDYVFTTGGIGPTHDDITADAVAAAFGVDIGVRADALEILENMNSERGEALTPARRRMARIPEGASLIGNPVSGAPGFQIGNVFVLAGVPGIMRGMLQDVGQRIRGGAVVESRTVSLPGAREGDIAASVAEIQERFEGVAIGSYPFFKSPADYGVVLVARASDADALGAAHAALAQLASSVGGAASG